MVLPRMLGVLRYHSAYYLAMLRVFRYHSAFVYGSDAAFNAGADTPNSPTSSENDIHTLLSGMFT